MFGDLLHYDSFAVELLVVANEVDSLAVLAHLESAAVEAVHRDSEDRVESVGRVEDEDAASLVEGSALASSPVSAAPAVVAWVVCESLGGRVWTRTRPKWEK